MSIEIGKRYRWSLCVVLFLTINLWSQIRDQNSVDSIQTPALEKFEVVDELITPWVRSGCHVTPAANEPDCKFFTYADIARNGRVTIYDVNGSVWHVFSVFQPDPDFYLKVTKAEFNPLISAPIGLVRLRVQGESQNWYEVVANEATRETKYVSKHDRLWKKVSWIYVLHGSPEIFLDNARVKLMDSPDGRIIDESSDIEFHKLLFVKADGDWAYVEGYRPPRGLYRGWIRWRKGRDFLVGCVFNNYKIPVYSLMN